jgi:hypothetical protein
MEMQMIAFSSEGHVLEMHIAFFDEIHPNSLACAAFEKTKWT